MTSRPERVCAAGLMLADGWAWAEACGAARLGLGVPAEVLAPRGVVLAPADIMGSLPSGASRYALACGEQAAAPDMAALADALGAVMRVAGVEFAALCLAAPAWGRTVYQGHLFAGGRHMGGLAAAMRGQLPGRAAVVGQEIVAQGVGAITQRLHALKAADVSVAVIDSIDEAGCLSVAAACAGQIVVVGPAWLAPAGTAEVVPGAAGPVAVLAGACDRQTLYQLGAARGAARFLQLNFTEGGVAEAVAWAGAPTAPCVIATSAPPDRLTAGADAAAALGAVARGLAAAGWRRFVLAGNDSAAAIVAALGVTELARGPAAGGLRWWHGGGYSFLLKPGGFGGRDLFRDLMEPQIGLNSAAE
jgi:uncharacterized protein YgbK (DUF1537 family)